MSNISGKTEIPYASWDLESTESQGMVDEMNEIKELAWKGAV